MHKRAPFWKVVCAATVGTTPTLGLPGNGYAFNVELNMTEVPLEGRVTSCQVTKLYIMLKGMVRLADGIIVW